MNFQNHHQTDPKIKFKMSSPLINKIVYIIYMFLFTEIPKISNTQATAGSDEGGGGAGTGRGK
jgi:hypothetical protein